jgi:hypothetical protein
MGNGAGVAANRYVSNSPRGDFDDLERKCKNGFYNTHIEDYTLAVTSAIKNDEIDALEMLIVGGDISSANALHIAAKYSALESLEVLLSAGISPFKVDKNGRTPLHISAGKKGEASVLCVYALIMAGDKSLKMRDFKAGNTPLHLAVTSNNVAVVEILLNAGASLSVTNTAGHSPRQIALSMKHQEIVEIIDEKRTGKLRTRVATQQQGAGAGVEKPVDMERVMAVWERFFENALSGIDFTMQDEEEDEEAKEGGTLFARDAHDVTGPYSISSAMGQGAYLSKKGGSSAAAAEEAYRGQDLYKACASWFSYVLSYDADRAASTDLKGDDEDDGEGGADGYFVASCVNVGEATQDLDDHLYTQEQYDVWCGYDYAASLGTDWPGSVEQLIQMGWVTFFDVDLNQCLWMYLPSGATENYLPVGDDTDMSVYAGLEPHDVNEPTWVAPPQVAARSWVMIRCGGGEGTDVAAESKADTLVRSSSTGGGGDSKGRGEKHTYKSSVSFSDADSKYTSHDSGGDAKTGVEEVWYYSNRISGHSCWTEPAGWEGLLQETGGWVLCAEEGRIEELYW